MVEALIAFALIALLAVTIFLISRPKPPINQPRFQFGVGPVERKNKIMPLNINLTNEEKILVAVNPTTPGGHPAQLDGPITVEKIEGEGSFEVMDDRSFKVISSDAPGITRYSVKGDADLGEGVVEITDEIVLSTAGAQASGFGFVLGTPEPK